MIDQFYNVEHNRPDNGCAKFTDHSVVRAT
jgi:hypothetical protein